MGYQLQILDPAVSTATNVFLIIANIINLVYNVPQVVKTYRTRSTRDFSPTFLFLRIAGNIIWVAYAIEVESLMLLINNVVTVLASAFIAYYKVCDLLQMKASSDPPLLNEGTEESEL